MPARWFRIAYAENAFRRVLTEHDMTLEELRLPAAVRTAMEFYREHRAQHTTLENGDDALAFSWGVAENGATFDVDIVRSMLRNDGTHPPVELHLRLAYRLTPARAQLEPGCRVCRTPGEADAFIAAVRAAPAYTWHARAIPLRVSLEIVSPRPTELPKG